MMNFIIATKGICRAVILTKEVADADIARSGMIVGVLLFFAVIAYCIHEEYQNSQ